jgi:RNA polymerase sigma-70 factor (ECF subfamily)
MIYLAMLEDEDEMERFENLYDKYKTAVANISYSILKNEELTLDALDNVFIKIAKGIKTLPSDESHERSYMYAVARTTAIDIARKKKTPILHLNVDIFSNSSAEDSPEKRLLRQELLNTIIKAIDKMEEKRRRILILRYVDDMKISDIARLLNIPEGSVKSHIKRGIAILRLSMNQTLNKEV